MKYKAEHIAIFSAHKLIHYPPLTEKQQFDILDNENLTPILELTEYKFVPTGLLEYYLSINPKQYLEHLKTQNLKEVMKFDHSFIKDGFYIDSRDNHFDYIFIDRNEIVFRKRFSRYDRLLNYLVYDRLNLYAPKKYKFAWLKKHFA